MPETTQPSRASGAVSLPLERQQKAEVQISERMSALRAHRGLTLESLAGLTGFTKSYLSKIENGKKVPPIGTLARIAAALGCDLGAFFQSGDDNAIDGIAVVRRNERQPVVRGGTKFGYDYVSLAHNRIHKKMEPFIFSFPEEIDSRVFFQHEGEEFVLILNGTVEFEFGNERRAEKWVLETGDAMYFDARTPHKGRRVGHEDAMALVVIYSSEGN